MREEGKSRINEASFYTAAASVKTFISMEIFFFHNPRKPHCHFSTADSSRQTTVTLSANETDESFLLTIATKKVGLRGKDLTTFGKTNTIKLITSITKQT